MKAPGAALAELAGMPTPAMADSPAKLIPAVTRHSPATEQLPTQKVISGSSACPERICMCTSDWSQKM